MLVTKLWQKTREGLKRRQETLLRSRFNVEMLCSSNMKNCRVRAALKTVVVVMVVRKAEVQVMNESWLWMSVEMEGTGVGRWGGVGWHEKKTMTMNDGSAVLIIEGQVAPGFHSFREGAEEFGAPRPRLY